MQRKKEKFWNIKKFLQFKNKNQEQAIGEIYIYDYISQTTWFEDEVTPKNFKNDLDNLGNVDVLNLYINSGGGDVFAAHAIYNMLKRHKAKEKNAYIDGLAASAASYLILAMDKIYMPKNAMIMIHNVMSMMFGNANDFRKMADDMEKINDTIVNIYAEKTNLSAENIKEYMNKESWFDSKEALALRFVDEETSEKQLIASAVEESVYYINGVEMDFTAYKNKPKLQYNNQQQKILKVDTVSSEAYNKFLQNKAK